MHTLNLAMLWCKNLYDCLNTMLSQHQSALWSALQRLSQNIMQWLSEPTRNKTASKYVHVSIHICA